MGMTSMNTIPTLIALVAALNITAITLADEPSDLWILSGQSNACGRAKLPGPKPDPGVQHLDPLQNKFVVAQDPLPGMGTEGVGPWVAAAQEVARGGVTVNTVGFASGGQPIEYWDPGQPGDVGLFPRITQFGQKAGAFLWYQGESNTKTTEQVGKYKTQMKDLVQRVRRQVANPQMTVVVVQLGAVTQDGYDFTSLREVQRQFVIEDGNALLVPALGRPLKDTVHLNNPGYQELGREIGRALLRRKYHKAKVDWPGPVLDAAVAGDSGDTITAHFAEVEQLSGCDPHDFAVVDAKGINACTAANPAHSLVELKFERSLVMPARLAYGFGMNPRASLVDEAGNRAPAVQIPVTTGAIPKDIPTSAPNGAAASVD
jgi:hypothetical protein